MWFKSDMGFKDHSSVSVCAHPKVCFSGLKKNAKNPYTKKLNTNQQLHSLTFLFLFCILYAVFYNILKGLS